MCLEERVKEPSLLIFASLEYLERKATEAIVKTNSNYLVTTFFAVDGMTYGLGCLTKNVLEYLIN